MSEETEANTEVQSTGETETAAESTPSYVTADQLQSFQKNMMGDLRKVMAGMLKTKPAPEPTRQEAPSEREAPSQSVDVKSELRRERAIFKAVTRAGFNDAQEARIMKMIDIDQPDDIDAYVAELASDFGVGKSSSEQSTTRRANPNPSSDGGKAKMNLTGDSDETHILEWSEERQSRLRRKDPKKFIKLVGDALDRDLKDTTFFVDKRK